MIIQRMSTHRKNECFFSQLFNWIFSINTNSL
jgi:hypothetical protein